jgi:hypothetical protein
VILRHPIGQARLLRPRIRHKGADIKLVIDAPRHSFLAESHKPIDD